MEEIVTRAPLMLTSRIEVSWQVGDQTGVIFSVELSTLILALEGRSLVSVISKKTQNQHSKLQFQLILLSLP